MEHAPPSWVLEARSLPIAFAQVREDPLIDLWVARQLKDNARVVMIASGGCTAALLACSRNIGRLHLVDPNPAQLALSLLKLRLLQAHDRPTRLALLGHAPLDPRIRRARIESELGHLGLDAGSLGPANLVATLGPDHAGRYERVFAALRHALADVADDLAALLQLGDPLEQRRRVAPSTRLGRVVDDALDEVMALSNLVQLFGEDATKNPVEPFARHFARRIRHALTTLPARSNPYLWQMLAGRSPNGIETPWLSAPSPGRLPEITSARMFMKDALDAAPGEFDFVHLSNILDWLSPEEARATLQSSWNALRPGGWVLIRQLNSTLAIPDMGSMFEWLASDADMLHAQDRSFFYRALHLGRRR